MNSKLISWLLVLILVLTVFNMYVLMKHTKATADVTTSEAGRSLGGEGG